MSDLFDDDPRDPKNGGVRTAPRRSRALLITGVILVLFILGLTGFASIYTDRLWYQSAGYGQVFSTLLWTRIGLFLAFGAVLGGAVAANVYLAYRFRPLFRPSSREQTSLDRYRDVVTPIRTWLVVGIAVVVGAFAGTSGMGHWRTYLLWRNGGEFGTDDPYFDRDMGFYVFDLPWYHFVVDFLMATMVVALIAALAVHYLYGGIRLQATHDRLSGPAQVQLSVLLGLFVLAKGVDYYLDRFDLVTQKNSLFTGMNYTGENAMLPSRNILVGVALICAVLFFVNVWRRTWQLPSVGLALLALSAVLLGMIWPAIVQQFQVDPSEADKEAPYIEKNIDATQAAYDLEDVETTALSPDDTLGSSLDPQLLGNTTSVPLIDPQLVSPAFENLQQQRGYYSVAPVLDVDRYEIEGQQRALVLGVRELDQAGLNDDARNWSNLHTVYTHGNGVIAAYANQRDRDDQVAQDESGSAADDNEPQPIQWAQGLTTQDDLSAAVGDFESRIYYGEQSPEYSVVGKADEDDDDVELNLPVPGSELGESTTYDGEGDADVGGVFNQMMFAIKFGEPNFLLSERVNSGSEVLFERNPRDRVEKVAPWLTVDSDAYPAVVDGRILWILDGYTTTDRFPNSQRESFDTMIDDALQVDTGLQTLPTDEINYMRNAVKATVDAYSGEVSLYAWDESDPLLEAWRSAFPDTVQDKDEMSEELMEHVRYPEDLFKVQRYQFARYHVEEANDWYENNDRWAVALDPEATSTFQAPYRLFVEGGEASNFALTSVYVPFNRNNLASFVQVNSDATSEGYGQMKVLELANADEENESQQTPGPGQVANEFSNTTKINNILLSLRTNAQVTFGNMLTFPVGDSLMYVQPLYAQNQSANASYPELRYVLVRYGENIGYGKNLQAAIRNAFDVTDDEGSTGGEDPEPTTPPSGSPTDTPGETEPPAGRTLQQLLDTAIDDAIEALDAAETARAGGDFEEYARQLGIAEDHLQDAADYREQIRGGAPADQPPPADGGGDGSGGQASD